MTDTEAPLARRAPREGWYRDPLSRRHDRYWDGGAWTDHTARRRVWERPWFVALVTVAVAMPLAAWGGVAAAHAARPAPPETFSEAITPDDEAKALLEELAAGIESYYEIADPTNQVPVILQTEGGFTYSSSGWEVVAWDPPVVDGRDGIEFASQRGDSAFNWCVSVTAPEGDVKEWKITPDGIVQGLCF